MEASGVKNPQPNLEQSHKQEALGRLILVEFHGCDKEKLMDGTFVEEIMLDAAKKVDTTVVNCITHSSYPFGCTCVVALQESHLSIRTWSCYRYAAVDLYICGDGVEPWDALNHISKQLSSLNYSTVEFKRGMLSLLPPPDYTGLGDSVTEETLKQEIVAKSNYKRDFWLNELSGPVGTSVRITGNVLYRKISPFQRIEVFESKQFGKMLVNDGIIMCAEATEHSYHEMIAHVPLLTHPDPKRVLIIGGGDGGTAREVLRHEQLERIVQVEIDAAVIEACKLHLPSLACSYDNPRLELIIGDGIKYVKEASDESFDIILVDSTDPIGPGAILFTDEFYEHCYRVLTKDGVLVTQSESPSSASEQFVEIYSRYIKVFGKEKVSCFKYYTPTYPGEYFTFSYCSKGRTQPLNNLDKEKSEAFSAIHGLQYYDEETHEAAFVHPKYVKEMIKEAEERAIAEKRGESKDLSAK